MKEETAEFIIIISISVIVISISLGVCRFLTDYAPDGKGGAIYQPIGKLLPAESEDRP